MADAVERGYPVPGRVQGQDDEPAGMDSNEASPGVETEQATAEAKPTAKPKPKKRKLPDDIPDTIEVDLGHFKGWATVTAERVKGRWLHYRLRDGQTGKVQIIGRDMIWRAPAAG